MKVNNPYPIAIQKHLELKRLKKWKEILPEWFNYETGTLKDIIKRNE